MVLFEALTYSFIWLCEGAYGSGRASKLVRDQRGVDAHPRTPPELLIESKPQAIQFRGESNCILTHNSGDGLCFSTSNFSELFHTARVTAAILRATLTRAIAGLRLRAFNCSQYDLKGSCLIAS